MANKFLDENGLLYFWNKIKASLGDKVDKVSGKGLSSNDYTTTDKTKLAGIEANANKYTHPSHAAKTAGMYKVTVDNEGHVSNATLVTKADITNLGISDTNTTYTLLANLINNTKMIILKDSSGNDSKIELSDEFEVHDRLQKIGLREVTQSNAGVMTKEDKIKLDGVSEGANKYTHPTTAGNKHIPAGGESYNFLVYGGDGTARWQKIPTTMGSDAYYYPVTGGTVSTHVRESIDDALNTVETTYAKKNDIVGMYKFKGSVATAAQLPTSGREVGDVYDIQTESQYGGPGMNVAWTGEKWDALGDVFDVNPITNAEIDAICV